MRFSYFLILPVVLVNTVPVPDPEAGLEAELEEDMEVLEARDGGAPCVPVCNVPGVDAKIPLGPGMHYCAGNAASLQPYQCYFSDGGPASASDNEPTNSTSHSSSSNGTSMSSSRSRIKTNSTIPATQPRIGAVKLPGGSTTTSSKPPGSTATGMPASGGPRVNSFLAEEPAAGGEDCEEETS